MQPYTHFTLEERESLRIKKTEGKSLHAIARELGRSVSSISRELKRNSGINGSYQAWRGCQLYKSRRKRCRRTYRLVQDTALLEKVCEGLDQYWSPEIIAQMWNREHPEKRVSHTTIYNALKNKCIKGYGEHSHLRRRGRRKYCRGNNATIHPEHTIHERPDLIEARERFGDWEGDTVLGARGKGGLSTCVDRKSRYLVLGLIRNMSAKETEAAFCAMLKDQTVHSITFDNGSEFAGFKNIQRRLKTTVFFADPHSPWQRGSNENINGLIRWFFPKGTDFLTVFPQQLRYVEALINNRPRKCLGWLSPIQFLLQCCS